jgi:hypothetical protein
MPCEARQGTRPDGDPGPRGEPCGGGVSPWPVGSTILRSLGTARIPEKSTRRPVNGPGNPRPHPAASQKKDPEKSS